MKYKVFLDDFRTPKMVFNYISHKIYNDPDWLIARDYDSFVKLVQEVGIDNISLFSLDHDLGFEHYNDVESYYTGEINYDKYIERTGYHCVKWLVDYCIDNNKKLPECIFHTQNTIGHINMMKYIENYRKFYE